MSNRTISARVASAFTIFAITVGVLSPIFALPQVAFAASVLQITCDAVVQNGNSWTFSGTFRAVDYPGKSDQYDSALFSPLGTVKDSSSKDAPDTFVYTLDTKDEIRGTWSNTETFVSAPASVAATLYHAAVPGNESSGDATCSFVIQPTKGGLEVKKVLVNDNGGTATASNFSFQINAATAVLFEADGQNDFVNLTAGAYSVTEVANPGYAATYSAGCTAGVVAGATTTCTITNNDIQPKLTVIKVVTNNSGGNRVVADFPLFVDATGVTSGVQVSVNAGAHTVSETNQTGYAATITGDCVANGTITLVAGDVKTCTITNDDIPAKLTVIKMVTNDNGGGKVVSDFTLLVDLATVLSGIQNVFSVGVKSVSELVMPGYVGTISGDCALSGAITLALGDIKSCTITNDDVAPSLRLEKSVIGGPNSGADWTLSATGPTPISGTRPVTSGATFSAGTYALSEVPGGAVGPYYVAGPWVCTGTGSQTGASIALDPGETAVCTITNTYTPPVCDDGLDNDGDGFTDALDVGCTSPTDTSELNESTLALCTDGLDNDGDDLIDLADSDCSAYIPQLTIVKTLINDSNVGGTKSFTDFSYQINGGTATAFDGDGSVTVPMAVGAYTVTEVTAPGYATTYSADCSSTFAADEDKTCTITNDDLPTTITVVKNLVLDSGKTAATSTFSFTLGESDPYIFDADGSVTLTVLPGTYDVTETTAPGFTTTYSSCQDIEITLGQALQCTITNDDIPACSDGIDNDNDGFTDMLDAGCTSPTDTSEGNESTLALCTDGLDNDGDELVDLADPDCADFLPPPPQNGECNDGIDNEGDTLIDQQDPQCSTNGIYNPTNTEASPTPTGGGGGITGLGGGSVLGASTVGQVLGASCGVYMDKYVRQGKRNNAEQVRKLQTFLNKYMNSGLPITGFYGPLSASAINAFQTKHADHILAPWGITTPTGIVYRTTLRQINMVECPDLAASLPELVEWSRANDPAKPE